jgi:hypothetical protein
MSELAPDEPWEQDVADRLRALPDVPAPVGFLSGAVDHRPIHAGRSLLLLVALAVGAVGLTTVLVDANEAEVAAEGEGGGDDDATVEDLQRSGPSWELPALDRLATAAEAMADLLGHRRD